MRRFLLPLLLAACCHFHGTQMYAQARDVQDYAQDVESLMKTYQRKMNAVLEEIGLMAVEAPDYKIGDTDIVTWLKKNRPEVYKKYQAFLDDFAKNYLKAETKEDIPSRLISLYWEFYDWIQRVGEGIARRIVYALENG